jgi:RsiW-degrading membrane proteinase PrsW (M82 family)
MTSTIVTSLLMAVIYLSIVRFADMNEKEPLWAMLLFFVGGAVVAALVRVVAPADLELTVLPAAAAKELGRFLAIGAGVGVLALLGQMRGWHDFNGTMDGVVYGTTAGLGFGTGERVFQELLVGALTVPGAEGGLFSGFDRAALGGLAHGVFGAIAGAGIGAAADTRSPFLRAILPLIGLGSAILAHVGYLVLGRGNALSGTQGLVRAWVALILPVILIALVILWALARERRAIKSQLADELSGGTVTSDELALLGSAIRREVAYMKLLFGFKLPALAKIKALHNRQVQLAFTKDQAARESDPERRARLDAEIQKLRSAIAEARPSAQRAGA